MTDLKSQAIQVIFTRLHALGVTPEQAAAGLRFLRDDHANPFQRGDFTIAPTATSEETFRAQVLGRTVRGQMPPEAPEYINLESVWEHCGHAYNKCEGPGECMCECPDCDMACKVEPKRTSSTIPTTSREAH